MSKPFTAVSIVSHGQGQLVDELIGDLLKVAPGSIQLLVLTLNLFDESVPKLFMQEMPWQKLLIRNDMPKGFGANHNAAFETTLLALNGNLQNYFWVVLNPDIRIPDPDTFSKLRLEFKAGIDLIGPAIIEHQAIAASARPLYTPTQATKGFLGFKRTTMDPPDWIAGMFMMIRATTFRDLNGFDKRYFLYCEDVELCLRIQLNGGKIYYSQETSVLHLAQRASHRSLRAFGLHLASAFKLWLSASFWRFRLMRLRKKPKL